MCAWLTGLWELLSNFSHPAYTHLVVVWLPECEIFWANLRWICWRVTDGIAPVEKPATVASQCLQAKIMNMQFITVLPPVLPSSSSLSLLLSFLSSLYSPIAIRMIAWKLIDCLVPLFPAWCGISFSASDRSRRVRYGRPVRKLCFDIFWVLCVCSPTVANSFSF